MCLTGGGGGGGSGDPAAKDRIKAFFPRRETPVAEEPKTDNPVMRRFRQRIPGSLLASGAEDGEPVNHVRKRFSQKLGE